MKFVRTAKDIRTAFHAMPAVDPLLRARQPDSRFVRLYVRALRHLHLDDREFSKRDHLLSILLDIHDPDVADKDLLAELLSRYHADALRHH
jgi:hypothetical protein